MSDVTDLKRFADFLTADPMPVADVQLAGGKLLVEHAPGKGVDKGAESEGLQKIRTLPPEEAAEAGAAEGNVITAYEPREDQDD